MKYETVTLAVSTSFSNVQSKVQHLLIPDSSKPACIREHILALEQLAVIFEPIYDWLMENAPLGSFVMDTNYGSIQNVILGEYGALFTITCRPNTAMMLKLRFQGFEHLDIKIVEE